MLDPATASDTLAALIDQARRAGADAADAVYVGDRSTSVGVRLGVLEDVSRAEGQDIGLRLFVGRQSAAVASSDLSRDSLAALVERGADVDLRNKRDQSPVAGALFKGDKTVVRLLISAGADLDAGTPSARETAVMSERPDLLD